MARVTVCDRSGKPIEAPTPGTVYLVMVPPKDKDGNPVEYKGKPLPELKLGVAPGEDGGLDLSDESYAVLYNNILQRFGVGGVDKLEQIPTRERKPKSSEGEG